MIKRSSKKNKSKVASEERFLEQRRRNPPRVMVRGNVGRNTIIRGIEVTNALNTDSSGNAFLVIPLIGGSSLGISNSFSPLQQVARVYNEFLFQSSIIRYIPSVGLTSHGNVTVSFLNNSEICSYLLETTRTWAEVAGVILGQANAVTHPVWHEFTYSMNLPARRKRFDINNTNSAVTIDTIERDCQGVFALVIGGAAPSTTISTPRRESVMLLEGLGVTAP